MRTGYPDHLDYEGQWCAGLPRRDSNPGLPGILPRHTQPEQWTDRPAPDAGIEPATTRSQQHSWFGDQNLL